MLFRPAKLTELHQLNQLIHEAKGFWGYSEIFLNNFVAKFGLTEEYMQLNTVMVWEEKDVFKALFSFSEQEDEPVLDEFFLAPQYIHQGLGKRMWQIALQYAQSKQWTSFKFFADPNSEGFYQTMGAVKIGEHESFTGRFVPIMRYKNIANEFHH